ncbi:coiled-coil-helix-coiled-coil-helix domain-containing protein 10, mitochondrial-like [Uranotaenia lowii]|uniref:coiled-coil-helix-coiled-coil-helix domain-containing protein 10, mitochondrial-like n=1 Tax=Uranotaenia lowii TaxID=190385 RepID=UPI00247953CD|nr:coiled-coil-helix-coiled-coil-helix domain-containing protein 10, mitochondrial-like [Uranotaenia lowii]
MPANSKSGGGGSSRSSRPSSRSPPPPRTRAPPPPPRTPPKAAPAGTPPPGRSSGIMRDIGTTAAGVAVGSVVGNVIGSALTGRGGEGGSSGHHAAARYECDPESPCANEVELFLECAVDQQDLQKCESLRDKMAACKKKYGV